MDKGRVMMSSRGRKVKLVERSLNCDFRELISVQDATRIAAKRAEASDIDYGVMCIRELQQL